MRNRETIDSELRLIALARRSIREQGGQPSSRELDELLDERLGHRPEAAEIEAVEARETKVVADITPRGHKGVLRRFGPLAALPLSLVAVAAVFVGMFAVHNPHPAAQPTMVPPSGTPPVPPPAPETTTTRPSSPRRSP